MSSSISSSDGPAHATEARAWTRFARTVVLMTGVIVALLIGAAILVDPWDSGRFGHSAVDGVRAQGPRTANASRGRDPQFDSAIIGNSHVQLLKPSALDALTGRRFVSLIAPGTRPREHLAILDWFVQAPRPALRSVVIGVDVSWCTDDAALPLEHPFPFWLYDRSIPAYLRGLMRLETIEETGNRIGFMLGMQKRRAVADGWWDYEPTYLALGYATDQRLRNRLDKPAAAMPVNADLTFPAAERLAASLAGLPAALDVILVFPPMFTGGPAQPTDAARVDAACKAAFARVGATRPRTHVIDARTPSPATNDRSLWFDHTHYRRPVAEQIEADIARLLGAVPR